MSFKIAAKVWDLVKPFKLDSGSVCVLMALADHANDEDYSCYPGVKHLADKCGMSERAIRMKLNKLIELDLISRRRTRNNTGQLGGYIYRMDFAFTAPGVSLNGSDSPAADFAGSDSPAANSVTTSGKICIKPAADSAGHNQSVNLSIEPIKEKPKKAEKKTVKIELPSWLDPDAWDEFREHRKAMKKQMTPLAEKKLINKLDALRKSGQKYQDVLNLSIENGWAGLFPIKKSPQNNNSQESRDDRMVVGSSEWDEYEKRADAYRLECQRNMERKEQEYRDSLNN